MANLQNQATRPEIATLIDDAILAVERDNPNLKGKASYRATTRGAPIDMRFTLGQLHACGAENIAGTKCILIVNDKSCRVGEREPELCSTGVIYEQEGLDTRVVEEPACELSLVAVAKACDSYHVAPPEVQAGEWTCSSAGGASLDTLRTPI